MKRILLFSFIISVFFARFGYAQAPANDECPGATVIPALPDSFFQDTRLATPNASDPFLDCADGGGGKTVWYSFTADSNGWIKVSSRGSSPSDYDIAIGIFTGTCGSLELVACNDDIDQGVIRQAELVTEVGLGETYYIHVAEWNGGGPSGGVPAGGDLQLRVSWSEPPPPLPPIVRGPKIGTIPGGVSVSTSSFPFEVLALSEQPARDPRIAGINKRPKFLDPPKNLMAPTAMEGANYKEDGMRKTQNLDAVSTPLIFKDFSGFDPTGYIPPDPIMAVGPDHMIVMVNSSFRIYDKEGTLLKTISYPAWWATTSLGADGGDPQVIYDHFNSRWVMLCDDFDNGLILLSVSDDADPLGTWFNWALPDNKLGDSTIALVLTDHPWLGFDDKAIYIMTREYCADDFFNHLRIVPTAQLYANTGGELTYTDFFDFRDPIYRSVKTDFVKPTLMYGTPGKYFLINAGPFNYNTYLTVWTISDPTTSPIVSVKNIPVAAYRPAKNAPQPGGGVPLENLNGIISFSAVYRDSALWATHTIRNPIDTSYTAVRYVKIDPFSQTTIEDASLGLLGYWYLYSAIGVGANQDVVVTFTRTSLAEYAGAFVSGRRAIDPPGLSNSITLKAGAANYQIVAGGRNRWGDYMGAYVDPVDSNAVWVHTEYAQPSGDWGTWVGKIRIGPLPGAFISVDNRLLPFAESEVGFPSDTLSFTIVNNGLDDLIISDISSPDSHFVVLNMPVFPLTLASFEEYTINVACVPEREGILSGEMLISSNDANNPLYTVDFAGKGYIVIPAALNTIYAVSGSLDGGRVYILNNYTGAGTTLGLSGYDQIVSLKINPITKELFGLVPSGSGMKVVRVSSIYGDAHEVCVVELSNIKGMAFRDDTLYIARINGSLYSVDLGAGVATLVANTGLTIAGIDVNPLTGELWASVRSTSGPDRIFKINLPSGTPELVGNTGFGVATQDLAFDAGGNLFGLVGTGLNIPTLILIDTLTAIGSPVGTTNIISGLALAIEPSTIFPVHAFRLDPAWELLSLPLSTGGVRKTQYFPTAVSEAFMYTNGYSTTDSLHIGRGYWLKFNSDAVKLVTGQPISSDTLDVNERWNMIGSVSSPIPISAVATIPEGIISSPFLGFSSGGYVIADSIYPGNGYWIRVISDGQLILGSGAPTGRNMLSFGKSGMAGFNKLIIKDAKGSEQVLYFGREPESNFHPGMYELPPAPPADGFSARFISNRLVETHPSKFDASLDYRLIIASDAHPVTVSWEIVADPYVKYALIWKTKNSGGHEEFVMNTDGLVTLGSDAIGSIILRAEQSSVPVAYALSQNYPNPFNPVTRIEYQLPEASKVTIKVYNTLGQIVAVLVDREESAGFKSADWNASDLASGIYFYRMDATSLEHPGNNFSIVEKMLLVR